MFLIPRYSKSKNIHYSVKDTNTIYIQAKIVNILSNFISINNIIRFSNLTSLPTRQFRKSTSSSTCNFSRKDDNGVEGIYCERIGWSGTHGKLLYTTTKNTRLILSKMFYKYPTQQEHFIIKTDTECLAFSVYDSSMGIGLNSNVTQWDVSNWRNDTGVMPANSVSSTFNTLTQSTWYQMKAAYDNGKCILELYDNALNLISSAETILQLSEENIEVYFGVGYFGSYDGSTKNKNWNKNIQLQIG